ncbi:hypothetical protein Tco_0004717 [Tanacetum coccineum]
MSGSRFNTAYPRSTDTPYLLDGYDVLVFKSIIFKISSFKLQNAEDLEDLYKFVKVRYGSTRPVEELDLLLWGDLKTMFDPHVEDQVWKKQQGYKVLEWKLYDSCGITLRVGEEMIIFTSIKPTSSLINRVYMLSLRERMELDLEARLMGETLALNRSLDHFFEDYIKLNDLNVPSELRRNQADDLMPTIKEDFAVLEDMDAYRNEGMGDVIFGKPFLKEVGINARQFEGMITIYYGNDEVTYQMAWSHPRFKHHTNEQCNKIPPLLKISEEDNMNGISHSYQKLKGFYKEVLNLDPNISEMQRWKNGSHAGTLACMRWNGEEKLKKSLT